MEYSEKVVDHYTNPRNVGKIENASGIGEVGNPVCGDIMKMFIKVENSIIVDVKFKTFGCGAAIATSSISTEMIKGKTIEEAREEIGMTIEAIDNIEIAYELAKKYNVEMPIVNSIYDILYNNLDPRDAVLKLMTRDGKKED